MLAPQLRARTCHLGSAAVRTAVWPCPSRTSLGHQGSDKPERPLWLPFTHPCFSCSAVGRFIPLIYHHYLCLEMFVKLFLAPPPHPRDTETPRILTCSHTSQLPIPCEMEGWQWGSTSSARSRAGEASRHHLPHCTQQR